MEYAIGIGVFVIHAFYDLRHLREKHTTITPNSELYFSAPSCTISGRSRLICIYPARSIFVLWFGQGKSICYDMAILDSLSQVVGPTASFIKVITCFELYLSVLERGQTPD